MIRFRHVPAAAAVAAALIGVLGACAPAPESGQTGSSSTLPPASGSTSGATQPSQPAVGVGGVTEAQAADLCERLESQLQPWRTYTPSVGRGGLNILVGEWAGINGVDLLALAGDRSRIDAITSAQCSDVREEAVTALEIPDLASGLVGF